MATLHIIESVVDRLKKQIPKLAVENFPDKPSEYRLNHPKEPYSSVTRVVALVRLKMLAWSFSVK
jgi:hypothetical protein